VLDIIPISAFDDNYIWLLKNSGAAVAVDPGEATPVLAVLEQEQLDLVAILITHHHRDHTGGISRLKMRFPDAVVFGPAHESIDGITHSVEEGTEVILPSMDCSFVALDMPGHTAGHVVEEMANSLQRISQLPSHTQLYCAHEYTLANLGFARWVEPQNQVIKDRQQEVQVLRNEGKPSVPSLLSQELEINPFLRTTVPAVIEAAEKWAGQPLKNNTAVFKALRNWKDRDYD